ncbi:MAG: RNA polymerase sigma-54 factor [Paracoccaceae bacterium]|jgi:RNA polymerase sigma-54 factor
MKLGPRLELRQSQQLVMTPQLQQAIKLLQMSNLDLAAYVDAELERNPLLEREPPESDPEASPADAAVDASLDRIDRVIAEQAGPDAVAGAFAQGAENMWDADSPAARERTVDRVLSGGGGVADGPWTSDVIAETSAVRLTLLDHLSAQIGLMRAPPLTRMLALALAADIDDAGYLRTDAAEASVRLGASIRDVEAAIALLQTCEPTGVGARDLAECLALQLAERDRLDPAMRCCLEHLDILARADWRGLAAACRVSEEDAREMVVEIRALDPRPTRGFAADPVYAAPPDLLVRRAPSGAWMVELNADTLPRVLVNNAYAAEVMAGRDGEVRSFISECRAGASWLVRSLEQRARTMLLVGGEIIRRQAAFFDEGVGALRPMTLRAIAEETGLHESTVSRVTAGKRLTCERGSFDLKFFFSQAIAASDGGDAHSAESIRHRIRALIDAEAPRRTLSDDTLVTMLQAEGVDIARRTVAKYREAMSIPSSVQRRRLKQSSLTG